MDRKTKKILIRGKNVLLSERNALDVLMWEGKEIESGQQQLNYIINVIYDSIKAGMNNNILAKVKLLKYRPKKLLSLSMNELLSIFDVVFYELEDNQKTDNNNGIKKKQEMLPVEQL